MTGVDWTHDEPDLSVVIVSWNTRDLLDSCLASVRDFPAVGLRHEVIVVDNGSADASGQLVRDNWPQVTLIENSCNEGYQRANNQGMAVARGRDILLLNADAQLTPGCLDLLVERLRSDHRAGVVAPRLVYGDGSWQRWTAGNEPTLFGAAAFFLMVERISRRAADRSLWLARDTDQPFTPSWVSSACLLIRRAVLDDTGPMDERFFAYMDDVDLCRLARLHGWTVWYEPRCASIHLMGQSTRRQTGTASPLALRNFNRYFATRNSAASTAVLQAVEALGFIARAGAHALLGVVGNAHHRCASRSQLRNARIALEPIRVKQQPSRNPTTTPVMEPS